MIRKGLAVGLAFVLAVGSLFCSMTGQVSKAEEGVGAVSGSAIVEQPLPEMAAVSVLSVQKTKSLKKVTVTWSAVNDVQGYYIMRKLTKGAYQNIASVQGTTYEDVSVQPGKTYTYQVIPWQMGEGEVPRLGSCANEMSISLVPGRIKGMKVKKGRGKFTVTWKKTANASGYQVYTKVFVKGIKTKYGKTRTLKSRKYQRKFLVKGMKYGFKVRAYQKVNGKKVYGPFSTVVKRY